MKFLTLTLCAAVVSLVYSAAPDSCADLGVPTQCSLTSGCETCYSASKSPSVFCATAGSVIDGMSCGQT